MATLAGCQVISRGARLVHCASSAVGGGGGSTQMAQRARVVFVLGAPGSGKGTQCGRIVREFGFRHLSAGDLLREERARPASQFGEMIEAHIREGSIVPVRVTVALLARAMAACADTNTDTGFLIDGFPRNADNLRGWAEAMADKADLLFVLFFECAEPVCRERCLERGRAGSGRSDDNADSLKKRFDTYLGDTMPVVRHYEGLNLVRKVDASPPPDRVFEEVRKIFEEAGISPLSG